jgi:8-oxo-dGTP pyrophosphatase MutT (NUDIX family)
MLIGTHGSTIKALEQDSGAKIRVSRGRPVEVCSDHGASVIVACMLIARTLRISEADSIACRMRTAQGIGPAGKLRNASPSQHVLLEHERDEAIQVYALPCSLTEDDIDVVVDNAKFEVVSSAETTFSIAQRMLFVHGTKAQKVEELYRAILPMSAPSATAEIHGFGVVIARHCGQRGIGEGEHYEYLLLQHNRGRHWAPAKGHCEAGEEAHACAVREVLEETGLLHERDYDIDMTFEHTTRYVLPKGPTRRIPGGVKVVRCFAKLAHTLHIYLYIYMYMYVYIKNSRLSGGLLRSCELPKRRLSLSARSTWRQTGCGSLLRASGPSSTRWRASCAQSTRTGLLLLHLQLLQLQFEGSLQQVQQQFTAAASATAATAASSLA